MKHCLRTICYFDKQFITRYMPQTCTRSKYFNITYHIYYTEQFKISHKCTLFFEDDGELTLIKNGNCAFRSKVMFARNFSVVLCDTILYPMKNTKRICVSVTYHNLRPLHTL